MWLKTLHLKSVCNTQAHCALRAVGCDGSCYSITRCPVLPLAQHGPARHSVVRHVFNTSFEHIFI